MRFNCCKLLISSIGFRFSQLLSIPGFIVEELEGAVGMEDCVVAVVEPVAGVDIGGVAEDFHQGCVTVSEDAVVEVFLLETLLDVDDDTLAVVAEVVEEVAAGVFALVAVAPAVGDAEGEGGGQHFEEAVAEMAAEEKAHEVEPTVGVAETVAVADEKAFAAEVHDGGFLVEDGSDFLGEVVEHPHVVVAREEMYLDAAISQFGEFAEKTCVASGHKVAVGEPEVENVAQEEEFGLYA